MDDESGARVLRDGAARLGIVLSDAQVEQFVRYRDLLLDWNTRINLTAIVEPDSVLTRHFLDSLTVALAIPQSERWERLRLIDVGAGAGLPGLALKIAFPGWRVTEVESIGKKARFIGTVVEELGLDGVEVVARRAEELGHEGGYREQFDIAIARAVASVPVLVEYLLPFCRVGGTAIMPKKGKIGEELAVGPRAAGQLGGRIATSIGVPEIGDMGDDRVLVVVKKIRTTTIGFPRSARVMTKRPL